VVRGWAQHPGDRHHGAHGDLVSRSLDVRVGELLDFSQNINPLGAPRNALEAARRALCEDYGRYPDLEYTRLRGALAAYLGVGAEMIVPTNGGAEALFLAARAAATGGRALVLEPTFSEYAAAARASGMEPVRRVARRREEGLRWDPTSYRDLEGVSVVFLCNPNNPTGDMLGRDEVLEVAMRLSPTSFRGSASQIWSTEGSGSHGPSPSSSRYPVCGSAVWSATTPGASRRSSLRGR
jgi:threonine-phosphate decarboxylase